MEPPFFGRSHTRKYAPEDQKTFRMWNRPFLEGPIPEMLFGAKKREQNKDIFVISIGAQVSPLLDQLESIESTESIEFDSKFKEK